MRNAKKRFRCHGDGRSATDDDTTIPGRPNRPPDWRRAVVSGAAVSPDFAGFAAAAKPPKRRKIVDRRASKGRKLRYHVQQKLVNFCAPVELEVPEWAEKVFARLFASNA